MLADDAYWLTHHDFTGERRTSKHAAGVMVATAMLGELIEAGAAGISHGHVVALTPAPALDELGADIVEQITTERRRHTAAQWLEYLGHGICERIARRMVAAGAARPHRTGLRRPVVIANEGDHRPAWVYAGLVQAVREGLLMDERQRFLLRLARHSSVGHQLLSGAGPQHIDVALAQTAGVWPPWLELLDTAVVAVRSAAVTR
jgi:Golgi phosphoprotein 3 GPP34